MREFSAEEGDNPNPGSRGEKKVLYDDFVDMLVVASPRWVMCVMNGAPHVIAYFSL